MKNKNAKEQNRQNRPFHIYRLNRENKNSGNKTPTESYQTLPNSKSTSDFAETIGYHLDPKRYDCLRGNKVEEKHTEETRHNFEAISVERPEYDGPSNREAPASEKILDDNPILENHVELDEYAQEGKKESEEIILVKDEPVSNDKDIDHDEIDFNSQDNENLDEYYGSLADNYVPEEETQIEEIITTEDIEHFEHVGKIQKREKEKHSKVEQKQIVVENEVVEEMVEEKGKVQSVVVQEKTQPIKNKKHKKYVFPSIDLLDAPNCESQEDADVAEAQKAIIDELLSKWDIKAHVAKYQFGPTVIVYYIEFDDIKADVKSLKKIENNLEMYLEIENIRLLLPIPKMRYAGIEVPKAPDKRTIVYLSELLRNQEFIQSKKKLPICVGRTNFGQNIYVDICDMPHGLVAGTSKSGKSVCLNSIILSMMYHLSPEDVRLILIDPKIIEFSKYNDCPHLVMPVITNKDYFEPAVVWLTDEMDRRYQCFEKFEAVEISEYNEIMKENGMEKMPYLLMIMDEFNDWFASASNVVDTCMVRLMQKARACGIHIILATQRPSADVIRGAIKTNISARLVFQTTSQADSVIILDQAGAEKLAGYGDMIIRCNGVGGDTRLQGSLVTNREIKKVMSFIKENNEVDYIVTLEEIKQSTIARGPGNGNAIPKLGRNDEIFSEVAYYVVRNQNASVNQLTKIFGTGFNKMDLIFRDMESLGIISSVTQGTKRKVLVDELQLEDILKKIEVVDVKNIN